MRVNYGEIKIRREAMGLSMSRAADLAGLGSAQRWSDLERGRHANPRVLTLAAVAIVLECSVDDFLESGTPKGPSKRKPAGRRRKQT
jgi:transcriptional regulator with XRE-family HTH domain